MKPVVAIIGRPNVGKSKLFNYLIGQRLSIVEDRPGVTRDRVVSETTWNGKTFDLVDTAGIDEVDHKDVSEENEINKQMMIQTDIAIDIADVVLFMTDAKVGLMPDDEIIARKLKRAKKKVILAVNKSDSHGDLPPTFYEFYKIGEPMAISAANATGLGDMLDEIVNLLPEDEEVEDSEIIKVALIGKPNVGKSSLINNMTKMNRNIVSNVPGTTRDAVDTPLENEFGKYVFIDTAGVRKRSKINDRIEKFSVIRTELAVERADVSVLVIDAEEGPTEQDAKILGLAHNMGKAIIILVNKWDKLEKDNHTLKKYENDLRVKFSYAPYAPILTVSALTGQRTSKIFELINKVYDNSIRTLKTTDVNKVIEECIALSQPPSHKGKKLKIYYGVQSGTKPPTFTLFVNNKELFHFSYQRYILNSLRKVADFEGVRLKMNIRERNEKI